MTRPARVLEGADLRRLLRHVRAHRHATRNHAMVLLSFKAGLRACEIAGLSPRRRSTSSATQACA